MSSGTRVGTVIEEKYRLDEQIGHGSMGAVYRGTQIMVDRAVAIKLLHPTFAGHDQIQARFEVEAKAIARLNHPNCITLFDFGYSAILDAFYTVVEFIDGQPLGDLVSQRPSVKRVVKWVRQIASALGHAHHHGILHRDLKPENIMLANMTDGREMVKVLDFGIAQIMKGSAEDDEEGGEMSDFESDRITRVGEVFGTPPYMSPEQCESARDLTPATDLYSLGIIFYELLEGRLPFMADAPVDIMRMHINDPPPPLKRAGIPDELEAIVLQMLAKNPDDRPESGDEIAKMLEEIPDEDLPDESAVIGTPDEARENDPTLLSAPPTTSDTIIVDDGSLREESGVYELNDIAPESFEPTPQLNDIADESFEPTPELNDIAAESFEPTPELKDIAAESFEPADAASANASKSSGASSDPFPSTEEIDALTEYKDDFHQSENLTGNKQTDEIATATILDTGAHEVKELATKIAKEEKRMVVAVVAVVVAVSAALVWVIIEYEPFSMAGEDDLSTIGEVVARPHSMSDQNEQDLAEVEGLTDAPPEFVVTDDDEDAAEEQLADDELIDDDPGPAEGSDGPSPTSRRVAQADEEDEEEDQEDPDEEPEVEEEPEPRPQPRPRPRPRPEPEPEPEPEPSERPRQPPRLGVDDGVDDDPSDEEESQEEETRAPPRLGL